MHFVVRWLHVASVSFLMGGAVLILALIIVRHLNHERVLDPQLLQILEVYEYGFWAAVGLVVMTGVGNLGAFGPALPETESPWGEKLIVKLLLVLALVLLSVVRTLTLAFMRGPTVKVTPRAVSSLEGLYGASVIFLIAIMGIAVSMAHF